MNGEKGYKFEDSLLRLCSTFCYLRIRAARGRECVYVLHMFFLFLLFFSVRHAIVHRPKYQITVLGNG